MSVVIADPLVALCGYLTSTVGDLLDTVPDGHGPGSGYPAVFTPLLPKWADSENPLASIIVRRAGGYNLFGSGLLPVADPKIDFTCYAGNADQANVIAIATTQALKQLTQSVWEGTTLFWAKIAAGPIQLLDTQALWPAYWLSAQVMHSEVATAS